MIESRNIFELEPAVRILAAKLIDVCAKEGIDLLVTSTFRDMEAQAALFAKGRTARGPKVTNARPGQSFHNYRVAFDVVPIVHGKAIWNDNALWQKIGQLGTDLGLEWAGNWKTFKEMPHFQFTNGRSLADFQAKK
jgi:peptidoglycan L-alanyl-D-glutamate endopeptidase CwlK